MYYSIYTYICYENGWQGRQPWQNLIDFIFWLFLLQFSNQQYRIVVFFQVRELGKKFYLLFFFYVKFKLLRFYNYHHRIGFFIQFQSTDVLVAQFIRCNQGIETIVGRCPSDG